MSLTIFPAIDLRQGRVVRLKQGRPDAETQYGDDPSLVATQWQSQGAEWLHVVNLDGAFGESVSANQLQLTRIVSAVSIPIQLGGGLRDLAAIEAVLKLRVARVVLGTAAIENPQLVADAVTRFGTDRIVVGIDARNGMVATRGWREQSQISVLTLAQQMCGQGVTRIIVTDIARDGMLRGVDADAIAALAQATQMRTIASGGVASLGDIQALAAHPEIEGVIIGQALYSGAMTLREAFRFSSQ